MVISPCFKYVWEVIQEYHEIKEFVGLTNDPKVIPCYELRELNHLDN